VSASTAARIVLYTTWVSLALTFGVCAADAQSETVRTVAGSGALGYQDGAAANATFMMPIGMAYDQAGNLYVADGAAQRIRLIDRAGNVRTIAGGGTPVDGGLWVAAGYADGPASQARFNRPAGIAIAPSGDVFIADSFNHCIRRMRPDGEVSTFAGSPSAPGSLDGPRSVAQFQRPTGLAFDRSGNLYVADPMTQLRKIDPAGNVSYIQVGNQPTDVAVYDGPAGPTIFVAGFEGLIVRTPDGKLERFSTVEAHREGDRFTQGGRPLGHPFWVTALDDHTVIYTDVRSNTVRSLDIRYGLERILGGPPNEDASADTGGYADGIGGAARFDAPMGIVVRPDGAIIVADAGNRRIRTLSPPDRRGPVLPAINPLGVHDSGPQDYTVALAGNSFVWFNTDWDSSIEGRIERSVMRSSRFPAKTMRLRVVPVWGTGKLDATDQYLKTMMHTGLFNAVLLNINAIDIAGAFGLNLTQLSKSASVWQPRLTEKLRVFKEDAAAAGVPVAVVIEPLSNQLTLGENAWFTLTAAPAPLDLPFGSLLKAAVRKSGVPLIDLWPAFEADLRSPAHRALFGSEDPHFSLHGREVAGAQIARALLASQPWRSRR